MCFKSARVNPGRRHNLFQLISNYPTNEPRDKGGKKLVRMLLLLRIATVCVKLDISHQVLNIMFTSFPIRLHRDSVPPYQTCEKVKNFVEGLLSDIKFPPKVHKFISRQKCIKILLRSNKGNVFTKCTLPITVDFPPVIENSPSISWGTPITLPQIQAIPQK